MWADLLASLASRILSGACAYSLLLQQKGTQLPPQATKNWNRMQPPVKFTPLAASVVAVPALVVDLSSWNGIVLHSVGRWVLHRKSLEKGAAGNAGDLRRYVKPRGIVFTRARKGQLLSHFTAECIESRNEFGIVRPGLLHCTALDILVSWYMQWLFARRQYQKPTSEIAPIHTSSTFSTSQRRWVQPCQAIALAKGQNGTVRYSRNDLKVDKVTITKLYVYA